MQVHLSHGNVTDISTQPIRRLNADARRTTLLDAARDLALERSLSSLTMEGVAARAGVNKAIVYRHAADIGDLRAALFLREIDRVAARIRDVLSTTTGMAERLGAILDVWVDEAEAGGRLIANLMCTDLADPAFVAARRNGRARLHTLITNEITSGVAIDVTDAELLADMLIAAANGLVEHLLSGRSSSAAARDRFLAAAIAGIESLATDPLPSKHRSVIG